MFKKLIALFFLLMMSGSSWAASTPTTDYDPYNLYFWYVNSRDEAVVYNRYGNGEYNFFYQLRDIAGSTRSEQVAGPQWFATVYENYYRNVYLQDNNRNTNATLGTGIYRRTMGGEIPEIPFSVVGDIIDGFNFVFAEEPEPYETAWRRYIGIGENYGVYDIYPDPLESFCLVLTNGQGDFSVSLGNPYARHFPFWWNYGYLDANTSSKWWQRYNGWQDNVYSTMEPVEYILSGTSIYHRIANGRYTQAYSYVTSSDASGDVTLRVIQDTSGNTIYTLSGDLDDTHYWVDSEDNVAYTVSGDQIYNSGGTLAYTLENSSNQDTTGDVYICEVRNVNEAVAFSDFDQYYTITVNPSNEQAIPSGNYLNASVRVRGIDSSTYGSRLGYITFRQRASFATGYSNYRQSTMIPMVIANVSPGNAADNPLMFDMIVFTDSDDVVNRIKFTWDAQNDMPDQDLGTFFMMRQFNASSTQPYKLETRITNRTGTRYALYRYDEITSRTGDDDYRDSYRRIMPDYWKYDLTQDMYGTLPDTFLLDAHSQIAPGLVTVYKNNVGEGYRTIDTQYDTSESFRLYEYSSTSPRSLRLNYKRVAGMTTAGQPQSLTGNRVSLQGFNMQFVDITQDENETEYQLTNLMGKPPVMVPAAASAVTPSNVYISSSALNSFTISKDVPAEILALVSYDEVVSVEPVTSNDTASRDASRDATVRVSTVNAATEYTSARAALQPVSIRLRIPRQYRLINGIWDYLDSASNSRELFERFSRYGAVWVRSSATREYDTNLFTAINNKGSSLGVSAADCVRAFLYDDELYLDFIILLADAKSKTAGRTAFIEIFEDDGVPYVLIGDGAIDKKWNLQFYVDETGENPETRDPSQDVTPIVSPDISRDVTSRDTGSKSGGGGGCDSSMLGAMALMLLAFRRKD